VSQSEPDSGGRVLPEVWAETRAALDAALLKFLGMDGDFAWLASLSPSRLTTYKRMFAVSLILNADLGHLLDGVLVDGPRPRRKRRRSR
jgi:hypothetical protein